jgi:uncharacterized protein (TIGR00730 family)
MFRRVCVFCGSSPGARPAYAAAAAGLADELVTRKISIVYGGSNVGLMRILADTALAQGGEVIGVIPRSLVAREVAHTGLSTLHLAGSMHERKALMAELSDAFIALPGGFGTLDEFCEILTWTQLGLQRKPAGLLNVEGYYDHLLQLFDHAVAEQFVKPAHRRTVIAEESPAALIERLLECELPTEEKWIARGRS